MRKAMAIAVLLTAAVVSQASPRVTLTPLIADVEGAGWWWNTANNLHMLMEGPWDVDTPVGGYCYKCGGFHRN